MMKFFLLSLIFAALVSVAYTGSPPPDVDDELSWCLSNLTADAYFEVELEYAVKCLTEEFEGLRVQVDVYQWYRDDNRTLAMNCLVNLSRCNDDNDWKEVAEEDDKRSVSNSKKATIKHPHVDHETKIKNQISSMDRHFKKGKFSQSRSSSKSKHHARDVAECSLEECLALREDNLFYQEALENKLAWLREHIILLKDAVMAWERYSRLYHSLLESCEYSLGLCVDGYRLLRVSYVNGGPNTNYDGSCVDSIWTGYGPTTYSTSSSEFCALEDLTGGDSSKLNGSFLTNQATGGAIEFAVYPDHCLGDGEVFVVVDELVVDPEVNVAFSFVAGQNNSFYQVTVEGDSFPIFDNGSFIYGDVPVNEGKRYAKPAKRYNWPNLDCGAVGTTIPFPIPHTQNIPTSNIVGDGDSDSSLTPYGYFTIEEVRFVANYPDSIPDYGAPGASPAPSPLP